MKTDLYEKVTAKIVAELESGHAPWVRPWDAVASGNTCAPCNATTNKPYRGINVLLLWIAALERGYSNPRWLTFNQCKAAKGFVRKGETGTKIYFFKMLDVKDRANKEDKKIPLLREFTVFNVAQCDGLADKVIGVVAPIALVPAITLDSEFDIFAGKLGADIRIGGDRAFYSGAHDFVGMPEVSTFKDVGNYRSTLAHELTHWTGHESRMKRDLKNRFGTRAYAAEELIAELGAAFLCAEFGMQGDLRHAGYIASWIELLKEDKRAIFTASSAAQKAADYLLQTGGKVTVPAADCGETETRLAA